MNTKFKKGISLLEVLIVMGIISITILASFNLAVGSIAQLKSNEISDFINSVGVGLLEVSKSPANIYMSSNVTFQLNQQYHFAITKDSTNRNILTNDQFVSQETTDCNSSSKYIYKVDPSAPDICVEFIITKKQNSSQKLYYEIVINITYGSGSSTQNQSLKAYRFSDFKIV